jgi:hypothetical protein
VNVVDTAAFPGPSCAALSAGLTTMTVLTCEEVCGKLIVGNRCWPHRQLLSLLVVSFDYVLRYYRGLSSVGLEDRGVCMHREPRGGELISGTPVASVDVLVACRIVDCYRQ